MSLPASTKKNEIWRSLWLPALIIVTGLFVYTQLISDSEEEPEADAPTQQADQPVAAAAPEALLSPDTVMPTAQNYDCFTNELYLTCFFSDRLIGEMEELQRTSSLPFTTHIATQPKPAPAKVNLGDTSEFEREE